MSRFIYLLFSCLAMGQASADDCIRKYKQPNGIIAYDSVPCEVGNGNGSSSAVRPEPAQQKTAAQTSAAFFGRVGQPLSLDFKNIDIRSLLQVFSDFIGTKISIDDTVAGTTSIVADNIPWTEALFKLISQNHLVMMKVRSGYYVCPAAMSDDICRKRATNKGL
jgi:hypothetical protein